ncbi:MAG: ABC transporter substrate-binding protein [Chloroflexi bacterium]|nr:ABC transporter substrate-binding protein [Chloroflexota bacterium]
MALNRRIGKLGIILLATLLAACAAPAPTATPTSPPAAAPTPTKAPTATPTKRPLVKTSIIFAGFFTSYMPAWVARGKGYFEDEGLDMDWVVQSGGAKALAAVVGQSAPLGMVAAPDIMSAVDQGQPVQSFVVLSIGQQVEMIMGKEVAEAKGITEKSPLTERVNALKGLKLAASSPGGGTDLGMRYLLNKYNIDPDRDVEVTYLAAAARNEALYRGAIDAMASTQPDTSKVILEGKAIMLVNLTAGELPELSDTVYVMGVAHRSLANAQSETLEGFTRAIWRGQKLIQQNRDDAREAARSSSFADMDPAVFRAAFDATFKGSPPSPAMDEKQFRATLDYRSKTVVGPPLAVTFDQFYTNRFVEAAKKQLGY